MIRKSLTILSLIGLLLSVGLWGVSYYRVTYHSSHAEIVFSMGCCSYLDRPWELNLPGWRQLDFIGFGTLWWPPRLQRGQAYPQGWYMIMPLWIPSLAFGSLLYLSYLPLRRRRERKKLGLCIKCGYDLRGSKNRCPECGQPFDLTL